MKMTATCGIQKFRWREKNKTLVEILGVVNTGRPLQVKYWGVATPATPAALTPMLPTSRLYYKPGGNTRQTGKKSYTRKASRAKVDVLRRKGPANVDDEINASLHWTSRAILRQHFGVSAHHNRTPHGL